MLWTGVLLGLGAATAQSLSYIFSRLYVIRRHQAVMHLLVLGHVFMGAMSLLMLPLLPIGQLPPVKQFVVPLLSATVFYLAGQASMFLVLRHVEASRVSPLLGLKIPILAVIATLFLSDKPDAVQWLAVAMSVAAAVLLARTGGSISVGSLVGVLAACMAYSLSDLSILALVRSLEAMGAMQAIFVGVCLCYSLSGLAALAALPWTGRGHKGDWRFALPWAVSWLGAMMFLFACFASIGVVHGNIVQSTRGLISVLMGAGLAALGLLHLEQRVSRGVLLGRAMAAVLMCLAIAMYSLTK